VDTIPTIFFFLFFPLTLIGALSMLIRRSKVKLIESIAIGVTIWVFLFLVVSKKNDWWYQADTLTSLFFLLVLPASVTICTFRAAKPMWLWLLTAVGASSFLWGGFVLSLPTRSGYELFIFIACIPIIAGVCCFSAVLLKTGPPFEFYFVRTFRKNPYLRHRRLLYWIVAIAHLAATAALSQGSYYAYRQYEQAPRIATQGLDEPMSVALLSSAAGVIGFPLVSMANPTADREESALHPDNWILFSRTFWIAAILNSLLVSYLMVRLAYWLYEKFRPRQHELTAETMAEQPSDMRPLVLAGAMALTCGLGYSFSPPKLDFGMTGTVIDATTKRPIAGAYVVALYHRHQHSLSHCVMSRGMYVADDGKYKLPITGLNQDSPRYVAAIKPGYFAKRFNDHPRQNANVYTDPRAYFTGRDIELTPQNAAKPERVTPDHNADGSCDDVQSVEDAAASIQFLKIELEESTRLGVPSDALKSICRLQNAPAKQVDQNCAEPARTGSPTLGQVTQGAITKSYPQ
jgi:hypothetical protein